MLCKGVLIQSVGLVAKKKPTIMNAISSVAMTYDRPKLIELGQYEMPGLTRRDFAAPSGVTRSFVELMNFRADFRVSYLDPIHAVGRVGEEVPNWSGAMRLFSTTQSSHIGTNGYFKQVLAATSLYLSPLRL